MATVARKRGRPPAGRNGEARSTMRSQVSARVSDETYAQLKALTALLQVSQAEVITRALDALERALSPGELKIVELLKRRARG